MIKNERQYRITAAEAERLARAFDARPEAPPSGSEIHARFWETEGAAIAAQIAELRAELAEYEALRDGERRVFGVRHLGEVPRALIEGRIASGLTHKELAVRLGLPEQAIQRYEATDYAGASLERLRAVASAIGIELSGVMAIPAAEPSPREFFTRLKEIGLNRRFVLDRLVAPAVAAVLEDPARTREGASGALLQAAEQVERIFSINPSVLFSDAPLRLDPAVVGATRFKPTRRARSGKSVRQTSEGYVFFAHYLALLTLQATAHLERHSVPSDPVEWRSSILARFGSLTLEHVLQFLWSVGIPVLPLRDDGVFHGACWRTGGRDVIVLKQRSQSEDRWTFDALHECGHIVSEPEVESFAIIEDEVPAVGDPNEQAAMNFAGEVVLDSRADELAERAVELANGDVRFLEQAADSVAEEAGVSVGALANYLAFRIAEDTADEPQKINWWGTAARLQRAEGDPWRIARDLFLEYADLTPLNQPDRELLIRSLKGPMGGASSVGHRRRR